MKEFVYLAAVAAMAAVVSGADSTLCLDDGTLTPNANDCSKYSLCYMGKTFNFSCPRDTANNQLCFVAGHEICGRWDDCKCLKCKSPDDNHKWPDLTDERAYYQCEKEEVKHKFCNNNEVFDPKTLQCRQKEDKKTCPQPGSGELVRYPHHCLCQNYYECKDGELTLQKCPDGLWFDVDTLTCRSKEDARCNGMQKWCTRDGIYPDETSCYYYHKCENGVKTTCKCKYGTIFDDVKLLCVPWDKGNCNKQDFSTPDPNSCRLWDQPRKPNKKDCNRYYECVNGKVMNAKCLENHQFNEYTQLCDLEKNVNCHDGKGTDDNCPAVDCGRLRYPHANCEWYYECRDGKKLALKCPTGLFYNKESEMCDLPSNVNCSKPPLICPPGSVRPHECQCNMYYLCGNNEEKIVRYCPTGKNFDEETLKCVAPEHAKCHKEHKDAFFDQTFSYWLH